MSFRDQSQEDIDMNSIGQSIGNSSSHLLTRHMNNQQDLIQNLKFCIIMIIMSKYTNAFS